MMSEPLKRPIMTMQIEQNDDKSFKVTYRETYDNLTMHQAVTVYSSYTIVIQAEDDDG